MVLLYHLDISWARGGFLGVDIFFVISGYLITRNILHEIREQQFSFAQFYKRRAQRLFPALGFTVLITLIAGFFVMSSFFYEHLAQSSISALLSISNFHFWLEGGYFDLGASYKPLLHTWSLGLEEQFYLLWPLLIFVLAVRWSGFALIVFWGMLITSLGLCYIPIDDLSGTTFYLLPFRIFEFGLGVVCLMLESKVTGNSRFRNACSAAGLLMILSSGFYLDRHVPMPGVISLWPCLGAVLVIIAAQTYVSRFALSNKIMEMIGKASYSVYLIHWPLITFFLFRSSSELTEISRLALSVMSIALGYLIWRFVESPFRNPSITTRKVWLGIGLFFLSIGALGAIIWMNEGFPGRDSNPYKMTREEMQLEKNRYWEGGGPESTFLNGSTSKKCVVMGNSHSIDLIYALKTNDFKHTIVALPAAHHCFNFGFSPISDEYTEPCKSNFSKNMASHIWQSDSLEAVFLNDDWRHESLDDLMEVLVTIRSLTDVPVYVFGPKMVYTRFADVIVNSSPSFRPEDINAHARGYAMINNRGNFSNKLKAFFDIIYFKKNNISFIDLLEVQGTYEIISSQTGNLLYFDSNHFTLEGAREMGERLRKIHPYLFD